MSRKPSSLKGLALQKFKKNFWGVLSLSYILLCGFIALFAYVIAPDSSENANQMHLSIHSKPPGFTINILTIPSELPNNQGWFSKRFLGKKGSGSEIAIDSYSISDNNIAYLPHTGDDIVKITKVLELSLIHI